MHGCFPNHEDDEPPSGMSFAPFIATLAFVLTLVGVYALIH
jgi:hypothetical protein